MAEKNGTKDAPKAKPTYGAGPVLTAIPQRTTTAFDMDAAKGLLEVVTTEVDGAMQTASDGLAYADATTARTEANRAKRLLAHVAPNGKEVTSRVYADGTQFRWAIWLTEAKAEAKPETASA